MKGFASPAPGVRQSKIASPLIFHRLTIVTSVVQGPLGRLFLALPTPIIDLLWFSFSPGSGLVVGYTDPRTCI